MWQHWLNFVLGLLVVVLAYSAAGTTSFVVVGILVVIFALWGALGSGKKM